jgi:hypothetical protein
LAVPADFVFITLLNSYNGHSMWAIVQHLWAQ